MQNAMFEDLQNQVGLEMTFHLRIFISKRLARGLLIKKDILMEDVKLTLASMHEFLKQPPS